MFNLLPVTKQMLVSNKSEIKLRNHETPAWFFTHIEDYFGPFFKIDAEPLGAWPFESLRRDNKK